MAVGKGRIIEVWKGVARKELEAVKSFLTTPKGLFETVDEMVKHVRYGVRETVSALGIRLPQRLAEKLRTVM